MQNEQTETTHPIWPPKISKQSRFKQFFELARTDLKANPLSYIGVSLVVASILMNNIESKLTKDNFARQSQSQYEKGYHEAYTQGYADSSRMFKQWLLDVDFAEYDRKTGEWKLCDPTTIQGSLIEPRKKSAYVNVNDYALAL